MTDIDHELKEYRRQQDKKEMEEELNDMANKSLPISYYDSGPSIFDLIFDHSYKTSLKFMQIRPIEWMIRKKWKHYSKFLYIGLFLHIVLISFLTASAVKRITSQATKTLNQGLGAPFPNYFAIIMVIISPLYLWLGCFKIVQICRGKFQITCKPFSNPYANAAFHALFFIFALCIIIDLGLTWYTGYNNMSLIIAVVIGWFILLFFLRATRFFCFFTSLIQRILLQDITRFAPIIAIQLLGFSTAMFMLLYNPNNENNKSWWQMLMFTFESFVGGGDIEIADSIHPVWLSIIYVTFIIMTTILMLNALIAILSSTCTDLLQNFTHDMHLHLQQLAVILFFEGLLPNRITQKYAREVTRKVDVYTFDKSRNRFRKMTRHLMRIYLVEEEGGNGGMVESSMFKLITDLYKKQTGNDESYQSNPSYSQHTSQENNQNAKKYRQNKETRSHRNCRLDIHDLK